MEFALRPITAMRNLADPELPNDKVVVLLALIVKICIFTASFEYLIVLVAILFGGAE